MYHKNRDRDKVLADLHLDYVQRLPKRIADLEQRVWEIIETNFDRPIEERCFRDVHDLCGSSGTHGYSELSKKLRHLEKILHSERRASNKRAIGELLVQIKEASRIPPNTPEMFKGK